MTSVLRFPLLAAGTAAIVALAGCSAKDSTSSADVVSGKKLFVQNCGSCHVLARAGTKGVTGPNLDHAFANPVAEGFGETAIRGMVRQQIDLAREGGTMPADLVKGDDAKDVAAYVASVVDKPGKDTGLLATQAAGSDKPAVAQGGKLTIPADPGGQLAFVNKTATAPAGQLTIEMPNESGGPHNIAIEGKGAGKIVAKGSSSFSANFAPGTYTYLCKVDGHAAAGMKGVLTVK